MTPEMKYSLYISILAVMMNEALGYFGVLPLLSMLLKGIFVIFTIYFTYSLVKLLIAKEVESEDS